MAPTKPSKKLLKKLKRSNIRVERPSGVTYRVLPVRELKDPIERYLPPAGRYYDESAFNNTFGAANLVNTCVLCWNTKTGGQNCECTEKCTLCGTKQHRGRDCPKVYASIKWWQSHGHHLRKKSQLRPNPGEHAYLVIAGVFKDWKRLGDPVVVNFEHPVVKACYKGKDAPYALTGLLGNSRPTLAAAIIDSRTGPCTDEISSTGGLEIAGSTPALTSLESSTGDLDPSPDHNASVINTNETDDVEDRSQTLPVSPKECDNFLGDLLEDTWRPSAYHEGTRYATVTPLSIRLAITTAQSLSTSKRITVSAGNEVRADLDPRLRTRTPQQDRPRSSQSISKYDKAHYLINSTRQVSGVKQRCEECHGELQKVQKEIEAKDRRIRELELALHESEGWTDAVTYREGQKRLRL